jgi:two-component system response regulator AlgR
MNGTALRVLLIDDEPLARTRLRSLLGDIADPPTEVCGEAATAVQVMELLESAKPQVLLLDIHMPGMDGMQLAHRIGGAGGVQIVFVTASNEFALQAFDVDAADYLTKPVRAARLQQALFKAAARLRQASGAPVTVQDAQVGIPIETGAKAGADIFLIQECGRTQRLLLSEILYARAEQKYVILHTRSGQECIWDDSLNLLEEKYPEHFVRIHRNTLALRRALRQLKHSVQTDGGDRWQLQLEGSIGWLQVSRRQLPAVRHALKHV